MDVTQLKYFIALAQTLNFSEAARRCGITQPSMSHSIVELEKQLGAPLFVRSRKGVTITEAGRELLPSALEMVDIAEKTAFRIHQMELGKTGSVSISALTTSSAILSKCLKEFSRRYPDILTDITFTSGRSEVLAMNEAKYDFHFAVQEMVPAGESFDSLSRWTSPGSRASALLLFPSRTARRSITRSAASARPVAFPPMWSASTTGRRRCCSLSARAQASPSCRRPWPAYSIPTT